MSLKMCILGFESCLIAFIFILLFQISGWPTRCYEILSLKTLSSPTVKSRVEREFKWEE
jgi:hypothetical protein